MGPRHSPQPSLASQSANAKLQANRHHQPTSSIGVPAVANMSENKPGNDNSSGAAIDEPPTPPSQSSMSITTSSIMEEVDRTAARVAISAMAGLTLGASIAIFKGAPIGRTSMSVSASCALAGTACFGSERVANNAIRLLSENTEPTTRDFVSHGIGGVVGGGIAGGLFQGRVLSGSLLFTPIMLAVAFGELRANEYKRERLNQLLDKYDEMKQSSGSDR